MGFEFAGFGVVELVDGYGEQRSGTVQRGSEHWGAGRTACPCSRAFAQGNPEHRRVFGPLGPGPDIRLAPEAWAVFPAGSSHADTVLPRRDGEEPAAQAHSQRRRSCARREDLIRNRTPSRNNSHMNRDTPAQRESRR